MALLEIRDLVVVYYTDRGVTRAVDGVSMDVAPAQHLGIIGESGCGKTTLLRALVRVLPRNAQIISGEINFKGRNLLALSRQQMRDLRWREIAIIPQASMDSLDPVQRVGDQLTNVLTVRGGHDRRAAKRRAADLFDLVGLDTARLSQYPHEFSGGMKQRAVIAMALALEPSLLIADEPVTALDVVVQHQILETLQRLENELDLTVMLVTHDISVVAQVCDSVAVMYAGRIVEQAEAGPFFDSPYHPYSLGLQNAFPNLVRPKDVLISIEGYPPELVDPPEFCRFAMRCPFVQQRCREIDPRLEPAAPGHLAACLRADEMETLRPLASDPDTWREAEQALRSDDRNGQRDEPRPAKAPALDVHPSPVDAQTAQAKKDDTFVQVEDLVKRYQIGGGLAGLLRGQPAQQIYAVNGVSFDLARGESLGLAGESGCGKTTTGMLLVKLIEPSEGRILFDGQDISQLSGEDLEEFRRRVQLMFQNPYEALNPRFTLYRSLSEPLIINGWRDAVKRRERILDTLERVQLQPAELFLDKYPHQLSGGQLQRVVLARSLILHPDFLVADEPVSMLDVSVRAGILNTMRRLTREMNLTTVYISHDLSLLQYTCDCIAIMYLGQIMEIGPTEQIIHNPQHPYTQALVSAVPVPDPNIPTPELSIDEGVPRATRAQPGCPFQDRCPEVMAACLDITPPWIRVGTDQYAFCHLYGEHADSPKLKKKEQLSA
ncbi:MAG: ABC transporter ATP-binding protein [Candidatus Promineifilaceae bacterium]|nr:ABC transporter ATP-binding protein [Candidatus Promineifilaceae bacterium]